MRKQYFTRNELLVVLAILVVLIIFIGNALSDAQDRGRQTGCKSNLKQHSVQLAAYYTDLAKSTMTPNAKGQLSSDHLWFKTFDFDSNQIACRALQIKNKKRNPYLINNGAVNVAWGTIQNSASIIMSDALSHKVGDNYNILTGDGSVATLKADQFNPKKHKSISRKDIKGY